MNEAAQALGQRLKAAREKRGVSTQKMANDMHLDPWVIDALEAGDYARIGPSVYAQGHLRKYSTILGVSATEESAPVVKPAGPPPPTPIIRLEPPSRGSIWPTVGGFAAVALVAGGIVWWRPWHASARSATPAPGVPVAASAPAPESEPAVTADATGGSASEQAGGAESEASPEAQAPARAVQTSATSAARELPRASDAAAAAPAGPVELTPGVGRAQLRLSFSADSRVAVYDYTGKSVFMGNGRANSVKTLTGMAPFRVYLGFASGVQLQVNDRAVAIGPQFVSGDVARFEAGADGVLRRDPRPVPTGATASASPDNPRG